MANTTISPNMNLIVPTVGVEAGPTWASDLNASLTIIDGHNHTSGQGVSITPGGLNINSDLPFGINNATLLRSVRFSPQLTTLSSATDIGCLYEAGVDLYYNDGNGNQIRITQSGSVSGSAGTITGLPSGTASAAYQSVPKTFVFQSSTNTSANLDGASLILRNLSASSNGLTLSPPSALASNYTLTLPTIPSSTSFVTMDSSGNFGTSIAYPLQSAGIATQAVLQSNLAPRATGTTVAAGGVAVSASCGNYSATASLAAVTNLSVTITTTGRPVMLLIVPDGNTSADSFLGGSNGIPGGLFLFIGITAFFRGSTQLNFSSCAYSTQTSVPTAISFNPSLQFVDIVSAGTYTYTLQAQNQSNPGTGFLLDYLKLVAYEM